MNFLQVSQVSGSYLINLFLAYKTELLVIDVLFFLLNAKAQVVNS